MPSAPTPKPYVAPHNRTSKCLPQSVALWAACALFSWLGTGCASLGVGSVGFAAASTSDAQLRAEGPPRWQRARANDPLSSRPVRAQAITHPEVARRAQSLLGQKKLRLRGQRFRADCSGLVRGLYVGSGVDLFQVGHHPKDNGVARIYRYISQHGTIHRSAPGPGEIVFFDNTYDHNKDGRRDDPLTHVGVVERVRADGTVVVIHFGGGRVSRLHMNLAAPGRRRNARGEILNDPLRRGREGKRLAGQLFVAFGRLPRTAIASRR